MSFLTESLKELWDAWHIRGLIILSLLVQSFLILFAPLRKQRGGKWHVVRIGIWLAYLFADWVAIFTIGLILRAQSSDVLTLWAPFLLLHLGGPDTITSFSLEDNELWIRHLLGLLLQVGSTVYIILLSLSNNKLWLPTLLVLTAGIIKYAERNRAFYLASFDQFGNNWEEANKHLPPVPAQFSKLVGSTPQSSEENLSTGKKIAKAVGSWASWLPVQVNYLQWPVNRNQWKQLNEKSSSEKPKRIEVAVYLLGIVKSLLVGPPLSSFEKLPHPNEKHDETLQAIEISLSLLYELLHTKLPVVHSQIGYVCRIANLGCILGALVSFSLLKTHHYESFDIWLTYGLLIGALALDLISIMLLISSDWITMAHFQKKWNSDKFINQPRWSNSVPQLNIFNICDLLNKEGSVANKDLFDILGLRSLLKKIRRTQWVKFASFVKDQEWKFIFTTLTNLQQNKDKGGKNLKFMKQLFRDYLHALFKDLRPSYEVICSSLEVFGHMESLLMWHIVTEYCYKEEELQDPTSSYTSVSTSNDIDHRRICKLLSDYMFYLWVMEPTMIPISPNSRKIAWRKALKKAFEGTDPITLDWLKSLKSTDSPSSDVVEFVKNRLHKNIEAIFGNDEESREEGIPGVKMTACRLVNALKKNDHRWEIMANIWVWILFYAAISCQPSVHARQVSKGGQLLTLVWLLMNYMGFIDHSHWFPLHAIRP